MNIPGRLIRPNFNLYKHSWKHISILSFHPLQQTSIPHMEKHIHGYSTCYKFSVFTILLCNIWNNDMTEPFPWKMLVKVLMLLLLVSTSRCFSNYILTHSSKHVELHLLNIDHTPFLLVPRNFRTFSLVEDMRRSQVSTRTLGCMHSLIRTQILDLRMRSANPQPDAIITKTLY